jgi:endonuclease/exonuclease/phosphatase family metal-dependent hydrolase
VARPLRLMTWNVRSLRDDRDAVVRVIVECAPDVLFVQEAPRFLRARSKLAAVARESGLVVAASGRPAVAVAILTTLRIDVHAAASYQLSKTPGLHSRGVAVAQLSLGATRFAAASVHLGLKGDERQRHASEVLHLLASTEHPAVIAGDFNERSDGPAWQAIGRNRTDVGAAADLPTFSASDPRRRIDTIFTPDTWSVAPISPLEIVDESDLIRATDHRPVIVDVVG